MRILVIAPHADDEINCAGLLSKYSKKSADIVIAAFSRCEASMPPGFADKLRSEFLLSCLELGVTETYLHDYPVRRFGEHRQEILENLIKLRRKHDPEWVICPSSTDLHQDHTIIYAEVMRAFRNAPLVLGWESPNNQRVARVNAFVSLDSYDLERKQRAFTHYESQHHRSYFDSGFINSLAEVRGKQCRCKTGLAEGYEVLNQCL